MSKDGAENCLASAANGAASHNRHRAIPNHAAIAAPDCLCVCGFIWPMLRIALRDQNLVLEHAVAQASTDDNLMQWVSTRDPPGFLWTVNFEGVFVVE
jgi:hypothetical protein